MKSVFFGGSDPYPLARLDLGALSPTSPPTVAADLLFWHDWTRRPILLFGFNLLATVPGTVGRN